jgi:hypothetical protein
MMRMLSFLPLGIRLRPAPVCVDIAAHLAPCRLLQRARRAVKASLMVNTFAPGFIGVSLIAFTPAHNYPPIKLSSLKIGWMEW